ncbi:MAG: flagellar assembly protein H [Candidatus Eremiobacteraeota bacterium]|nr:flagellar assembly protein H [Candidatus Eremiobacteraeota bacterium]MCW5868343.1 flagellar assembly protein H [Candidatus Eremiobacteraeota bacterium]
MTLPHDSLFKELLTLFLEDFVQLFVPEMAQYLEPGSLHLIDKELYPGRRRRGRRADMVARGRVRGTEAALIVHFEHDAQPRRQCARIMFFYYSRLHEDLGMPVYPVMIYSYPRPRRLGPSCYRQRIAGRIVVNFRFRTVQLNRLNWRDFIRHPNPVACALMARMHIDPPERIQVKWECLRLLVSHRLDSRKIEVASKFIDAYLNLSESEELELDDRISELGPEERASMQDVMTSWERKGLLKGLAEGRAEGLADALRLLLEKRFGEASRSAWTRLEYCRDEAELARLVVVAGTCFNLAEFESHLG